jgi:hypothetical protein
VSKIKPITVFDQRERERKLLWGVVVGGGVVVGVNLGREKNA